MCETCYDDSKLVQKTLHHDLYTKVLSGKLTITEKMRTFKSYSMVFFVEEANKIISNSADNKRYFEEIVYETLAFGHY